MADGSANSSGGGRATAFLSGLAAVATVVAAVVGILAQFGLIGGHDTPKASQAVVTPAAQLSPAASPPAASAPSMAASAKPSPAQVAEASHPHRTHKPKTATAASIAASTEPHAATTPAAAQPAASNVTNSSAANAPTASAMPTPGAQPSAASSTLAMAEPAQPPSLTGAWRDMGIGACHLINQTGGTFDVTNYDPATGEVMSQGRGSITGNHVEIDFAARRHPVTADLHVSPDGRSMFGKIFRIDGPHRTLWKYIGPNCPTPG